ncbi:CBS domain-containing protein [Candidatus Pacearchaeota archaeon]|nr:CBS domain-containing protein [Candidatus Pacearchaeota archaeon]
MDTGVKVGDLMTRNFIFINSEANLLECTQMMVKKRVGSLLIKDSDKLKGFLTRKDILWAIVKKSKNDLKNIKVKDLMRRKIITIKPSEDITDAMFKFKRKKVRRLPVVEKGKLIGLLTMKDVLKIDPGLFQMIAETIKIKEETEKLNRKNIEAPRKHGICEECGEWEILYHDEAQWLCESCYNKR